jgi:hypothetical protein
MLRAVLLVGCLLAIHGGERRLHVAVIKRNEAFDLLLGIADQR